ncbi:MAG: tetratricopeptide repeat protein [Myxococcota bacterium]
MSRFSGTLIALSTLLVVGLLFYIVFGRQGEENVSTALAEDVASQTNVLPADSVETIVQEISQSVISQDQEPADVSPALKAVERAIDEAAWEKAWLLLGDVSAQESLTERLREARKVVRAALTESRQRAVHTALKANQLQQAKRMLAGVAELDVVAASRLQAEVTAAQKARTALRAQVDRPEEVEPEILPANKELDPEENVAMKEKVTPTAPSPPTAQSLFSEGMAYLREERYEEGIAALNQCIQMDPNFCSCYRNLGIAYAQTENRLKAARYYRLFVNKCPEHADAPAVQVILERYKQQRQETVDTASDN